MDSKAYQLINEFYGAREAKRSKVPLINHIDEGIKILTWIGEGQHAKDAFCLHPIIQDDKELAANWADILQFDPLTIMYAMEYRSVANDFLSHDIHYKLKIRLSPLKAVNNMLIADKIQNRKDFELYHKGTHPRSDDLDAYFKLWLHRLEISEQMYADFRMRLKC